MSVKSRSDKMASDRSVLRPRRPCDEMMVWFQFIFCAAIILFAGTQLSKYAESIAEKSGFTKGWVGLVLLAVAASLSQLVASLSAVTQHDLPNMAVSALMGSCMFNMMVIGLLDLTSRKSPVSSMVHQGHILSLGFGIILLAFATIDILFGKQLPVVWMVHAMDPITVTFVPVYLLAMRLIFQFEKSRLTEYREEEAKREVTQSWPMLISIFAACAIAIIAASFYLPELAQQIAKQTGWGESFVGSSFIAVTTCLPELSVSVSSARRGAFDMAVASLLGSNLCYMVILAISDFCYTKEPLLRHVSQTNALAALSAIVSMSIVVVALTYRSEKKVLFLAGDALGLILVYVFANCLLLSAH